MSWKRFRNPPLGYVQQNIALDFFFPLHERLPQVSVERTAGSSPSRVYGSRRRQRLAAFEINYAMRGMHEVARAT